MSSEVEPTLKELIEYVSLTEQEKWKENKIPNIFYLSPNFECDSATAVEIYNYYDAIQLIRARFREPVLYAFENCPEEYKILLWKFCAIYYYGGATVMRTLCEIDFTCDSINNMYIVSRAGNPEIENLINEMVCAVKNNVAFCGWGAVDAADSPPEYLSNDVSYKKNVIPLHIYETWSNPELPPRMKEAWDVLREQNPEFECHMYNEDDRRAFIVENFPAEVVWAYDSLIPCSYKSDLWRFCILYKRGGIYLDCKYVGINGFKFIDYVYREYFVADCDNYNVYTALIICRAGNPVMLGCINKIIRNVRARYYGKNALCPTGPELLREVYMNCGGNVDDLYFKHDFHEGPEEAGALGRINIDIRGVRKPILGVYPTYREEQNKFGNKYLDAWNSRTVYADVQIEKR